MKDRILIFKCHRREIRRYKNFGGRDEKYIMNSLLEKLNLKCCHRIIVEMTVSCSMAFHCTDNTIESLLNGCINCVISVYIAFLYMFLLSPPFYLSYTPLSFCNSLIMSNLDFCYSVGTGCSLFLKVSFPQFLYGFPLILFCSKAI